MKALLHCSFIALCTGAVLLLSASAQAQVSLAITSPKSGAVVLDNQLLNVVTAASPNAQFRVILLAGQGLGLFGPPTAGSSSFTIPVVTSAVGPRQLTAVGVNSGASPVYSPSITIDVEPSVSPTSIGLNTPMIAFKRLGQQFPLTVTGYFADGSTLDLSASSAMSYVSANSAVVSVSNGGLVTAVGAGSTTIDVTYESQTATASVTVPASKRGDLNGDGRVDQDDLNIILAALNTLASGPNDARDLNHDGVINALDARILVTLCTNPGCATH